MSIANSEKQVELFEAEGISMRYRPQWNTVANIKNGEGFMNDLSEWTAYSKVFGKAPNPEQVQLRNPWSHIAKWGVEVWTPSMRIFNDEGELQLQCTRRRSEAVFALFGEQRKGMQELQEQHGKAKSDANEFAINFHQGFPTQEEIEKGFNDGPIWVQTIAAIQKNCSKYGFHVSNSLTRGLNEVGGRDYNDHSIVLNKQMPIVLRPEAGISFPMVMMPTPEDSLSENACLLDIQLKHHERIISMLRETMPSIDMQQTDRVDHKWPRTKDHGATWNLQRAQ